MREKAIFSFLVIKPRLSVRPLFYASAISAGVLVCAPSVHAHADDREQLKFIQADIVAKKMAVRQQQQHRAALLAQLRKQENTISAIVRKLRETKTTLAAINQQVDEMNAFITKLERQKAIQECNLAAQLDAAFRQGKYTGIQLMIISSEDSQRGQRLQAYFGYLNQARQGIIAELKQTRATVVSQKALLEEKQNQQQILLYEQKKQQTKLEQVQNKRRKILVDLESSIQSVRQQLSEVCANESRLRSSIVRAEAAAKAKSEREATESKHSLMMSRTGGLGQPHGQVYWPVRGPLLHRYDERLQGELRWKGIVIGAAEGSEVRAIADGRVILADWLHGYGLVVVVEHGKGDMSLYGYNQSALVSVGDQIHAGQPIALVGSSDDHDSPSLYFEIRCHGQAVNPQPWLGK